MAYWINTVSRDHVLRGVAGGFTQANHGKPHMLRGMERGDWIAFYSPKTLFQGGAPLQAFTAIGWVTDDAAYRVEMAPDFHPWRRNVAFLPGTEAPIRPLIGALDFIEDAAHWGHKFRSGVFAIGEHDFGLICSAMATAPVRDSRERRSG